MGVSLLLVAPDTINNHVKTCREEQKNLHFFAPEYGGEDLASLPQSQTLLKKKKKSQSLRLCPSSTPSLVEPPQRYRDITTKLHLSVLAYILHRHVFSLEVTNVTTAVDIYSFGMCALEVSDSREGKRHRREVRGGIVGTRVGLFLRPHAPFGFLLPADGCAGDSGQWRVLICATGSHQQRHPAPGRLTTEGKSQWGQFRPC